MQWKTVASERGLKSALTLRADQEYAVSRLRVSAYFSVLMSPRLAAARSKLYCLRRLNLNS